MKFKLTWDGVSPVVAIFLLFPPSIHAVYGGHRITGNDDDDVIEAAAVARIRSTGTRASTSARTRARIRPAVKSLISRHLLR